MKAKLIAAGIPEREIAFIHDFDTPKAKLELFRRVNIGEVRVLFGSTPKMGAGTNVQKRVVGLHHIDAPWRPSDLEQREGRVVRQGNELYERDPDGFEVEVLRYATEQTYDTRRWQIIEHKAAGVEQLRHYSGEAELEDIASEAANAAEMKAAASGSPLILKETELRTEVKRLESLRRAHQDSQHALQSTFTRNDRRLKEHYPKAIKMLEALIATAAKHPLPDEGIAPMVVDGKKYTERAKAAEALESVFSSVFNFHMPKVVEYRGLKFRMEFTRNGTVDVVEETTGDAPAWYSGTKPDFSGVGLIQRLSNFINRLPVNLESEKHQAAAAKTQNEQIGPEIGKTFAEEDRLAKAKEEHGRIQRQLMKEDIASAIKPQERAEVEQVVAVRRKALAEAETLSELAMRWHEATRTLSKSDQRHLEREVSKRLSVFGSVSLGKQVAQDALDEVEGRWRATPPRDADLTPATARPSPCQERGCNARALSVNNTRPKGRGF